MFQRLGFLITLGLLVVANIAAREAVAPQTGKLVLEVRNEDGRAIAGTTATLQADWVDNKGGSSARRDGQMSTRMLPGAPKSGKSDQNGILSIPASSVFGARQKDETKTSLLVINELQKLGKVIDVSPADIGQNIQVTLEPLCFVHAKVDSPDMEAQGHVLKHNTAWIESRRGTPMFQCTSENARVGMLVPAGSYELSMGGVAIDGATYAKLTTPIEIEKGQAELDLETLHFESSKLSEMLGKPAPELSGIIEWKNGEPVTMEQLRGKVVVLDFWTYACSICIAHMPELIALQKQYAKEPDLVIIAVHGPIANTLAEAYEKCEKARTKAWPGGDVPFRVALDSRRGFMSSLGISGVPSLLLVDRDGNVHQRFYHAGMPGFREEVAKLLNARPKTAPATTKLAKVTPTSNPIAANPALATPESALRAFLSAVKKGDAMGYRKVVSEKLLESKEAAVRETAQPIKIEPQEFFTKLTILDVKTEQTTAIINAKVVYNRKWLDAHNKDLSAFETASGAPAGVVKFQLQPEQGDLQFEDPIAPKGEGFAAFVMMNQPDGWHLHLGYMTEKQENLKNVSEAFLKKPTAPAKAADSPASASASANASSLKGQPAPDFSFSTLDGKTITLAEQKGSVVLLDYWATWCGPCKQSLPHLQKLSDDQELAAKGLKVLAINDKETAEKVKPFMESNKYTFTVPMDTEGKFGKAYGVRGIPTTVLVGRDGIIKQIFVGFGPTSAERIDTAVNEALKENGK